MNEYYDLLYTVLDDNGLLNSPRQLFNCDETFVPLGYSREKVVTTKGVKNVYRQSQGTSDHIMMLCCASAAGLPLPPLIIYSKCFPGGQYRFDGPDDALYVKSESGWIDRELFITWFKKIFLNFSVAQRPLLLLIDGHKSHMGLDLVDLCRKNNVILFCLPPHTTHALQPLDVSVFQSLKDHFSKSVRSITFTKKFFIVTKCDFARIIKSPFERVFSIPNVKAGFAKCGIYPFNRDAVPVNKMIPSTLHDSPLSVSSGSSSDLVTSSLSVSSSSLSSCSATSITTMSVSSTFNSISVVDSVNVSPSVVPMSSTPSVVPVSSTPSVVPVSSTPSVVPMSSTPNRVSHINFTTNSTTTVSPALISSTAIVQSVSAVCTTPTVPVNPLVMAGLIPAEMADILATPSDILATPSPDAAMTRKRTKRITGARDLTADDYRDMLVNDK